MNMKITSLTFLIAVVASMSFSQAVYAGEQRDMRGMRFDYAPNEFALEQNTGHRGGRAAANMPHVMVAPIAANSMPKSLLDKDFVSKPAPASPAPVVAAAPMARPSVSSQVHVPNAFTSLFNPVRSDAPTLATAGPLPAFGHPNVAKLPAAPMPKAPTLTRGTHTAIAWTPQHKRPVAALAAAPAAEFKMPTTKGYSSGFVPGANIPYAASGGSSTNADVHGKVIRH
jgi:hypothetical protein